MGLALYIGAKNAACGARELRVVFTPNHLAHIGLDAGRYLRPRAQL